MAEFTGIDISKLPAPDAVEVQDFEVVLARLVQKIQQVFPDYGPITEADPAYKILIVAAYEVMRQGQRINDSTKQNMLAFATGPSLDHRVSERLILRKELTPADPLTNTPAVMESDDELRTRAQLAPEAYSTAGPRGAYIFHALNAHPDILDAEVDSPQPRLVVVTILSRVGDGVPSARARNAVLEKLSGDTVRPLTDLVYVNNVVVVPYAIVATIYTFEGPDSSLVMASALAKAQAMVAAQKRIGRDVPVSAIFAALHVEGVQRVLLVTPAADIVIAPGEVGNCTGIELNHGGTDA